MDDMLLELARAKVIFQLRALRAIIIAPGLPVAMTRRMGEGDSVDVDAILRAVKAQQSPGGGA